MSLKYDMSHSWTTEMQIIASSRAPTPPDVIIERLTKPMVQPVEPVEEADIIVIDVPD
jgi:hypothetical protein